MKPYKQGNLDRFCSIYAVINAIQMLGVRLPPQKLYDYIIEQLNIYDSFYDTAENGADSLRLEQILTYATNYLEKTFKRKLAFNRPFYNTTQSFAEIVDYMERQRMVHKSVIIRTRSSSFDHYSVFNTVQNGRIKLFDSNHLPNIRLDHISHIRNAAKIQFMVRQLYVLELCK